MKSSSSFLWELIHSLTSAERLFFKRNFVTAKSSDERLYIHLFNALTNQKKYDEAAILKKFHPLLTKKNISFQKHYLQRQVCEALILYDSRNNESQHIYNEILLIRLYRKKGLLEEAYTLWKKAIARARQTESYPMLTLLKTEYEKMILFSSTHTSFDELHSIFKNRIVSYSEYTELITLRDIYTECLFLKRKAHYDIADDLREKIKDLLKQVNKNINTNPTQSFWFRYYLRMTRATLLYLLNNIPESLAIFKEVLEDWKSNPGFIKEDGEYYIELLYMINYTGILNGSYDYVTGVFNDKLNNAIDDPTQKANFEAIKYLALNKIYNKTARYNEVEALVQLMKQKHLQWEPALNSDLNRTVGLSLGIGCLVLEQYNDALYFTKRAITFFKDGAREEHTAVAQILLLIITYSLSNAKLFDAQHSATYKYFSKRKRKNSFEAAFVQCLHKTFYMTEIKAKIQEYQKTLDVFDQNKDDIVQKMTVAIFNYPAWLTSKVQRIPYRLYVERKVKEAKH